MNKSHSLDDINNPEIKKKIYHLKPRNCQKIAYHKKFNIEVIKNPRIIHSNHFYSFGLKSHKIFSITRNSFDLGDNKCSSKSFLLIETQNGDKSLKKQKGKIFNIRAIPKDQKDNDDDLLVFD